jgi:hypothetical protein
MMRRILVLAAAGLLVAALTAPGFGQAGAPEKRQFVLAIGGQEALVRERVLHSPAEAHVVTAKGAGGEERAQPRRRDRDSVEGECLEQEVQLRVRRYDALTFPDPVPLEERLDAELARLRQLLREAGATRWLGSCGTEPCKHGPGDEGGTQVEAGRQ